MPTDRMPSLDSRRVVTDRVGEVVVLGNSILSGAFDIDASATPILNGKSTAASNIIVSAAGNFGAFNGSFGVWAVHVDMDATATLVFGGTGIYKAAASLNAIAPMVMWGASRISSSFDSAAQGTYTPVASNIVQSTSTATLTMVGASEAGGGFSQSGIAALTFSPDIRFSAAFDSDSSVDLKGYAQLPAALDADAVATITYNGASIAAGGFSMNAVATVIMSFQESFLINAVASLTARGASTVSGGFSIAATGAFTGIPYVSGAVSSVNAATVTFTGAELTPTGVALNIAHGTGYFCGGYSSDVSSEIDGLSFTNESAVNPAAVLSVARYGVEGVSSTVKGYCAGGFSTANTTEIDGITFSDETAVNPSATLALARRFAAGVSAPTKGYYGGGFSTTQSTEIDGIQFSDEAAINPSAVLAVARYGLAGVYSTTNGYFGGGIFGGTNSAEIDGIRFSDDAAINPAATLLVSRRHVSGLSSAVKGYFCGGYTSDYVTEIDGIQFSDEAAVNPSATLTVARYAGTGISGRYRGYIGGGTTGSNSSEIDGLQFSDETSVNPSATLSVARYGAAGVQSPSTPANATLTMAGAAV